MRSVISLQQQFIGIGLRPPHYNAVLEAMPSVGWLEVHSENFFSESSNALHALSSISEYYSISLHGVGLSLGSAGGIQNSHLSRLAKLIERIEPCFISEHLSWSYIEGVYMPDLLPIPYTNESLDIFCKNLDLAQAFLKKEILIENPSSYIEYHASNKDEVEFLIEICNRTGAKVLLDINNVFVSASNHGWDPRQYINSIPQHLVREIHLAGHSTKILSSGYILRVDTHDSYVCQKVWDLYHYAIQKLGPIPTLLEWDYNIPPLDVLLNEASKALVYLTENSVAHA